MFVLGGEEKGKYLGQVFSYNFLSLNFSACSPMNEAKINFGAIYFKESVFVVGGWINSYTKRCEMYSIDSDKWVDIPSLKIEREGITLCVVQDRYIYAFGNVTTRGKRFKQVGEVGGHNLSKHNSLMHPSQNEKYMEYNFERLDIESLLNHYKSTGSCSDDSVPESLQWELVSVTSTFNITNMSSEKIPTFKNMGCFNHYKNKNQVIIFGGVV